MAKKKKIAILAGMTVVCTALTAHSMRKKARKNTYKAELIEPIEVRKMGFYEKYVKRVIDVVCATSAILVFSPLYIGVAVLVKLKLGSPVLFTQDRPGLVDKDGKETIFKMYKFRTMTDERDENGELLPDEVRLTKFGKWLRNTSLDELPEAFNILNGTMSVIGPRPQLVRDMIFMTKEQRLRHTARPGLSGLAQVNGRNAISWEDKLDWDLKYINKISFLEDINVVIKTVKKAFIKKEGITNGNMATAEDFGDYLLRTKKIDGEEYNKKMKDAVNITKKRQVIKNEKCYEPFSVAMSVYKKDNPIFFDRALESITYLQTVKPSEIVLVVDGEINAELNAVIEKYQKGFSNLSVIRLEENKGLGNALKIAVENAKYSLIARMDSDDISVPSRFEEQLSYFFNNAKVDIVGGDITEFIGDEKNIVGKRCVPENDDEIKKYMKKRCAMNHVSVMYRKEAVSKAGGYKDWFWNEDYYLWIRMCLHGANFANTGSVLVNVRVGEEMYQRRGGKKYFISEKKLQDFMLKNNMIGIGTYASNIVKRGIMQLILPNKLRGIVFRLFARE